MAKYGWLLIPVAVEDGEDPTNPDTFTFDNGKAYFDGDEIGAGAWGYIGTDEAPTFFDAKEKVTITEYEGSEV